MNRSLPSIGPMERALQLRALTPFRSLSATELGSCAQLLEEVRLRRNSALYGPREGVRSVFLLLEGQIASERNGRIVATASPPAMAGLVELLAGDSDIPRAVATSNGLALAIDSTALFDLIEDHFNLFLGVRQALAEELAAAQQRLGDHTAALPCSIVCPPTVLPGNDGASDAAARLLLVQRSPVFKGVNLTALAALIREREQVRLRADQPIWQRGEVPQFLWVNCQGEIRCELGPSHTGRVVGAGSVLGAEAVFSGCPHSYSAVAKGSASGFQIEAQTVLDLAEDDFDLAQRSLSLTAREVLRLHTAAAASQGEK